MTAPPTNAWAAHAPELARWAMLRLVNRTDRCGKYYVDPATGTTRQAADPAAGPRAGHLTDARLRRHFAAAETGAVVGAYAHGPDGFGKWCAVDIDNHDDRADPAANERYALHLYGLCRDLGLAPLLYESNGRGGFHLWCLFDAAVPAALLRAFGLWLVHDHAAHGLAGPPEVFPKTSGDTPWGHWLRLPGRHHTRPVWPRVWDGSAWAADAAAVRHVLSLGGDDPGLIPVAARAAGVAVDTGSDRPDQPEPAADAAGHLAPWQDYNRRAGLDDVIGLLERHGWTRGRGRRRDGAVDLVRPGKDAREGQGGNVLVKDGVPVFYCFTDAAPPLEPDRGYAPAALLALLDHAGDFRALNRGLAAAGYGTPQPRVVVGAGRPGAARPAAVEPGDLTVSAPPWPDPLGADAYHGPAGDVVRAIDPHTEADPVAILVQFLVGFGNAVGRHAFVRVEASRHHPNLFAVLVGQSSRARKGTSWQRTRRVLQDVDLGWESSRILSGLSSGEGLIWEVRDPPAARPGRKADDDEPDAGAADKRVLVVEEEFQQILAVGKREGNILGSVLRSAWDTGRLATLTKNSPVRSTGAHVSILAHITRAELLASVHSTQAHNGFLNRFLWVAVRRSKLLPFGGREVDLKPLGELVHRRYLDVTDGTREWELSAAARDLWAAEYPRLTAERPGLFGAVTSRSEAQTLRLALVYALLDAAPEIAPEHLRAALAVERYVEQSALHTFGRATGDPVADEIRSLLRANPGGVGQNDIVNHFGRNKPKAELERALGALMAGGLACSRKEGTGGRPRTVWISTEHDEVTRDNEVTS